MSRIFSLLNVPKKIVNTIVKTRVSTFLADNHVLSRHSYAFQRGKSTSHCINEILNEIGIKKARKQVVAAAVIDFKNVFESIDLGIDTQYSNCERVNKIQNFVAVCNGLPQGSVLSPILFNIATKELHSIVDAENKLFQFVDDFLILSSGVSTSGTTDCQIHFYN